MANSSSSSSLSSFSSSSTSVSTLSDISTYSSSTEFCHTLNCEGDVCQYFTNWSLNGVKYSQTDSGKLYASFSIVDDEQRIDIYSDSALEDLIAAGQSSSGTITLTEQYDSGVSGTVTWDLTYVDYPIAILNCGNMSSSTSSGSIGSSLSTSSSSTSSESISSISSLSSSSVIVSSSSSNESSSSSSTTSASESSTSSIDSSSSTSESLGNVSTSSSSSFIFFNRLKPLILANVAIEGYDLINRLAQTVTIAGDTYEIGKVYCYLYRARGTDTAYNINLSICNCSSSGKPTTIISTKSISAATVTSDNWYAFDFSITGSTPANNYLSFVMWQDGGDENNYVLWGYNENTTFENTFAWTSKNNIDWVEQKYTLRSLKVITDFDPYDLVNEKIISPPADSEETQGDLNEPDPSYENTKLNSDDEIEIDYPNIIASMVIDSSGSMGWNDRFGNRIDLAKKIINKFKNNYGSSVLFDIVKFGSIEADVTSLTSSLGKVMTINLDLETPSRNTYKLYTNYEPNVSNGDIYENNSQSFTINQKIPGTSGRYIIICSGTGDPDPSLPLVRTSGSGDININLDNSGTESSFEKLDITTETIVAYGFKTLEDKHTYNIGDLSIDLAVVDSVSLTNWQIFEPTYGYSTISLGNNGPNNTSSIDIYSDPYVTCRKPFGVQQLANSKLTSNISYGATSVSVESVSDFIVGDLIDIVNGTDAVIGATITAIDSSANTITFNPASSMAIPATNNAIVHKSSIKNAKSLSSTTLNLLVRDVNTTRNITVFLMTSDGLSAEWDFQPFTEWVLANIYFFGQTAIIPLNLYEKDGTPFPDGTKIELFVNRKPTINELTEQETSEIILDAPIGSTRVYLSSITGYNRNDLIDILDSIGNVQTTTIIEVGIDGTGSYIEIEDYLKFNILLSNIPKIKFNDATGETSLVARQSNQTVLSSFLSAVDVTPIYTNKSLDPSLLQPYDIERVPPGTDYASLNYDRRYIQNYIKDMPTIDGNSVVRVLPVTEDNLKTIGEKDDESDRLLKLKTTTVPTSQETQNTSDVTSTATTTSETITTPDYTIETPVYLIDGEAESAMNCLTRQFSKLSIDDLDFDNIIPGISGDMEFLGKLYTIYPVISILNSFGTDIAKQYFTPFDIYFISPITIQRTRDGKTVDYYVENIESESGCGHFNGYKKIQVPGVYASEDGFTIDYTITDQFILKKSGVLKVKIYSNKSVDLDDFASSVNLSAEDDEDITTGDYIDVSLPSTETEVDGQTVLQEQKTTIETWQDLVSNNPSSAILTDENINQKSEGNTYPRSTEAAQDYAKLVGGQIGSEESETTSTGFYSNPEQWTLATQYEEYNIEIPIVNGKASLTVPASDIVSLLFIEATVEFGNDNQYRAIATDFVFIANPIVIEGITPYKVMPNDEETYEIGVGVQWKSGSYGYIDDNTQVNFTFKETKTEPSTSVTDDGWAGGVFVGPHEPIIYPPPQTSDEILCPPEGEQEEVTIQVFHSSGYVRNVTRKFLWGGIQLTKDDDRNFFFKIETDMQKSWSDGSASPATVISSDLDDIYNPTPFWVGENGCERLKGVGQKNGLPRLVLGSRTIPAKVSWGTGQVEVIAAPLNQNIGHEQSIGPEEKPLLPWNREIRLTTSYINSNGKLKFGEGAISLPYPRPDGSLEIPRPKAVFREPLGITVSLEASSWTRDGVHSPNIVAEVTWKENHLKPYFIYNEGSQFETTSKYPLPTVTFKSGTCKETNNITGSSKMKDTRNLASGCLTVENNTNAVLSSYSAPCELSRTDIYTSGGIFHTHACTVDENGNGSTTSTINITGSFATHTHTITNYISDTVLSHSHGLRSVAITSIEPTTDTKTDFVVNAYVIYDPTNCTPYEGEAEVLNGNRMMFATLDLDGTKPTPPDKATLEITITTGANLSTGKAAPSSITPTFYTAKTPGDTDRGFDIRAYAEWSEYEDEISPGVFVTMPAEPVTDGSRITMEITPYKPEQTKEEGNLLVMSPGTIKPYMSLKVKATIQLNDQIATEIKTISIYSNNQWFPKVESLFSDFTSDSIYIDSAMNEIEYFGASQINDAIYEAANRIIQSQTDDSSLVDYKKIIFLLTDGDENTSQYSLSQAINRVSFINGSKEVPIIVYKLGKTYGSDQVLLKKFEDETDGYLYNIVDYTDSQLDYLINKVVVNPNIAVNTGIFKNTIEFDKPITSSSVEFPNKTLPTGSTITYRVRLSQDGTTWGNWSSWTSINSSISISDISTGSDMFMQYEVKFKGNSDFDSPLLNEGPILSYFKPQEQTTFFKPITLNIEDDEYVSSVCITHEAEEPTTSTITYRFTQSDSLEPLDYIEIPVNKHIIIPTRYNEILSTNDYKKYTATNGRWYSGQEIQVYKFNSTLTNGILVDSSTYISNPEEGTITFDNFQNSLDTFIICIEFSKSFRIICNVENKGTEAAIIHYVSIMYNVTKRIPKDSEGNIIHKPINVQV